MGVQDGTGNPGPAGPAAPTRRRGPFNSIKFFVFCHSFLQLTQLLVSGYMKSSISTIERRYGLSSQKSGLLAAFNEVGNTILIIFVSFFGSRVHRPRYIGGGALLACLASLLIAMPHFLSGKYTANNTSSSTNGSGLCQPGVPVSSNQSCPEQESPAHRVVYPLLLLGQLLLGVGAVPIQPFGLSYIDDYASKKNSPLYLGIVLAVTTIGPAFGFVTGSFMLRLHVDFDKPDVKPGLHHSRDLQWVGAWWLCFLVAAGLIFLAALPYLFFPREMPKEDGDDEASRPEGPRQQAGPEQEVSLLDFLKSFPRVALRMLRTPVYLLVVLAQVNMAALLSGLATFMGKFMEHQFSLSAPFAAMLIGAVAISLAVLGIVLGGVLMRRFRLSVYGAGKLCTSVILLCTLSALPLLFVGCSTQTVSGIYPNSSDTLPCTSGCGCPPEAFDPVCGADGVEFRSPCHAGCVAMETDPSNTVTNYTGCRCVGAGSARPGPCGSRCSHLLVPFMVLLGLTSFIVSCCQTPSYMMILRSVPSEDKSFAVGVQYMLFRVLAFLPGPVLYGSIIDTTCVLWGQKCGAATSCRYYDLDRFRWRFLGLQVVFVFGALFCFVASALVLRRRSRSAEPATKRGYELVAGQEPAGGGKT